ncbi:MAG: right-handed parallel beta-helix repeat-containing protein [Phycisphaerales bacterium]
MRAARSMLGSSRVVCGRVVACLLALAVGAAASAQTTWLVSNNPLENPDFPGLWEALESPLVVDGDTVEVSQGLGEYTLSEFRQYRFNGKAITVIAEENEVPVLRGSWQMDFSISFVDGEGPDTILDGFQILAASEGALVTGGSSPTIRNCVFGPGASARSGTLWLGYSNSGGAPRFESCEFRNGSSLFQPYIYSTATPTFEDCVFENNPSPLGGIELRNGGTLRRCDFIANSAPSVGNEVCGSNLWIEGCRFVRTNIVSPGHGAPLIEASGATTIVNCLFDTIVSPAHPIIRLQATTPAFASITNCTFGGTSATSLAEVAGLGALTVRNSIVWNNALSQPAFVGAVAVQYSNIQGGWTGTGNINTNPAFKAAGQSDFRLNPGSPCIDRGDNAAVPVGITLDLAGRPRFFDDPDTPNNNGSGTPPIVDMGAYEYQGPFVCVPDLTTTANPFAPGFGEPDGVLNNEDFFYYLLLFANANPEADLTTTAIPGTTGYGTPNGVINNDDFFYYLTIFAEGCDD